MAVNPVKEGLVGWWKLDEKSGTSAADSSDANNKAKLINGITFDKNSRQGVLGKALYFDGVDDGISFDNLKLNDKITVSAWAKISGELDSGHIVSNHPGWYLSGCRKEVMRFAVESIAKSVSVNFATPEKLGDGWHHYVGVYDGKVVKTYLDGELVNQEEMSGMIKQEGESRIGRYWAGEGPRYRWKGLIDEVRIYNRPLSNKEVQALFTQGQIELEGI